MLRTNVHTVHDGVATEQTVRIFQVVQALGCGFVAAVGDEAVGLQQTSGAHELVGIPPEAGAAGRAACAQDALVQTVQFFTLFGALQALTIRCHQIVVNQVWLDRVVLLEELRHVHDQVTDHWQAGQGLQNNRALEGVHVRQAGQAVLAIDVHGVRTADAFAAGAAERQRGVLLLQLDQGVQQHAFVAVEFDLDGLHVGLGVLVRIVAIDLECALHDSALVGLLFRTSGPWVECFPLSGA